MSESFKILDQRVAGTSNTTHYTVPTGKETIVKHITCLNTHASLTSTIKMFVGGTGAANTWTSAVSLAPGESRTYDGSLTLEAAKTIVCIASVAAAVSVTITGAEVDPTAGGGGGGGATNLDGLSDVVITSPTSGQILGYNGATWLNTSGGSGAVASDTIWDVKGDLAAGTGANTAVRVPIGANYGVLKADSAAAPGVRWGFTEFVNVVDYGAVGDYNGSTGTNNTTAFNNAIAACAAAGGGVVFIPAGVYRFTTAPNPLPGGVVLEGASAGLKFSTNFYNAETVALVHDYSGDFITFATAGAGAVSGKGGGLRNLLLLNKATRTGTAIKAAGVSGDPVAPCRVFVDNVTVSAYDGTDTGWTRDVYLDGTNGTIELRQWWFNDCQFFGATTAGETIRLHRCAAIFFNNCGVYQAPSTSSTGLSVTHAGSAEIHWSGGGIDGNVYTEAGPGGQAGLVFEGSVGGNITCAAGSARNLFRCYLGGTWSNSGGVDNALVSQKQITMGDTHWTRTGASLWKTNETVEGFIFRTVGPTNGFVTYERGGGTANWSIYRNNAALCFFESASAFEQLRLIQGSAGCAIEIPEYNATADVAAPAADRARLYVKDVGGKSQLCVRFASGNIATLASEV